MRFVDVLARVFYFANAKLKSCSDSMVCMQISSAKHGSAGKPKLSFGPV